MNTARIYSSPLRQQQQEDTSRRIVVAALELIAENPEGSLSHEEIARRAEIALRTVYRHFPSRTDLLNAVWQENDRRLNLSHYPDTEADMLSSLKHVFDGMDKNAAVMRGLIASNAGREMRKLDNVRRRLGIVNALKDATKHLPEDKKQRVIGIFQSLYSGLTWQMLRDRAELKEGESAKAIGWAMKALLDSLYRERAQLAPKGKPARNEKAANSRRPISKSGKKHGKK